MKNLFVFIGGPGVGKGSFAKDICCKQSGMLHFSVGDAIRNEMNLRNSSLAKNFSKFVHKGELVPDELVDDFVHTKLSAVSQSSVILDGFPRTIFQAKWLEQTYKLSNIKAIHIQLENWVAIEKLLGRRQCTNCNRGFNTANICTNGFNMPSTLPNTLCSEWGTAGKCVLSSRIDDTRETIVKRFEEYELKTAPLIAHYAELGLLRSFKVTKGMADVDDLIHLMNT